MNVWSPKADGLTPTMILSGRILFVTPALRLRTEYSRDTRKESLMIENCPNCGSQIVGDLFEEMWLYWCPSCGKEYHEDIQIDNEADIPGVEREP
jgi:DNA-directed RNA polymerase subunit RPC12/RpoP